MKPFWYIFDLLQCLAWGIAGLVVRSPLALILFIPLIALLIPVMIYIAEKQRKGEKVDYSW